MPTSISPTMSSQPSLPEHPKLRRIAEELDEVACAGSIFDGSWNLVWVSSELKVLIGEEDEGKLGYGKHVVETYSSPTWALLITTESQLNMFQQHLPRYLYDSPGGKEEFRRTLEDALANWEDPPDWLPKDAVSSGLLDQFLQQVEPERPPLIWTSTFEFLRAGLPPAPIREFHIRLFEDEEFAGTVLLYEPALPARVLDLVSRGDRGMFERMARLVDPGRRRAAILFADLEASADLSRRLPSAAYFQLLRVATTAIDDVVVRHRGIVGKHVGDGVTAFFLVDDLGSPSTAARHAVSAAREIGTAVRAAADEVGDETGVLDPSDCLVNVAVHWGGTLYMGQLVTGGRLEVTALGDEVNECARMQQTAMGGQVLASKSLVEHLTDDDAHAIDLDPDRVLYAPLGELEGAGEKAKKDAGAIPVTQL
jgi:class 3 adenylate cyclase